ncbi:MAG: glycine cleavage system protein GcvH [Candidatus Margulisbacteria bacterium]|nr:glycine cleavage system protein GcvH [Candidatus Margulisiibacteriota bacterium]
MLFPADLKYSKDHEWARVNGKIATIGITAFAQDQLGDIVYVELPPFNKEFKATAEFGVAESVKSVSSLFSPVSGKIIEVNAELEKSPQLVNQDAYGKGWMIKLELSNPAELDALMSAEEYKNSFKD